MAGIKDTAVSTHGKPGPSAQQSAKPNPTAKPGPANHTGPPSPRPGGGGGEATTGERVTTFPEVKGKVVRQVPAGRASGGRSLPIHPKTKRLQEVKGTLGGEASRGMDFETKIRLAFPMVPAMD